MAEELTRSREYAALATCLKICLDHKKLVLGLPCLQSAQRQCAASRSSPERKLLQGGGNSGHSYSGDNHGHDSGHGNSGYSSSHDHSGNSGYSNSGGHGHSGNSGYSNSGGHDHSGNSGYSNSGHSNSG